VRGGRGGADRFRAGARGSAAVGCPRARETGRSRSRWARPPARGRRAPTKRGAARRRGRRGRLRRVETAYRRPASAPALEELAHHGDEIAGTLFVRGMAGVEELEARVGYLAAQL